MSSLFDKLLHLDKEIYHLIEHYGPQTYLILFAIIFAETGFVVFPFLPGDSLLFAVGVFCRSAQGDVTLSLWMAIPVLAMAAVAGDQVNYQIGKALGHRLFRNEDSKLFKKSNLDKTHEFYEKYGAKTVMIARFVPFVRAFAPFVAGMSDMPYGRFCLFSIAGAWLWVSVCTLTGYFVGKAVGDRFELAIIILIVISMLPVAIEYARHRWKRRTQAA